jgi:hypothetical protein
MWWAICDVENGKAGRNARGWKRRRVNKPLARQRFPLADTKKHVVRITCSLLSKLFVHQLSSVNALDSWIGRNDPLLSVNNRGPNDLLFTDQSRLY